MMSTTTKQELLNLCKRYRWKGYSRMCKPQLLTFVRQKLAVVAQQKHAAQRIQRWYRNVVMKSVVNTTDFVTLEEFSPHENVFKLRQDKKTFLFNSVSLLQSMFATGKFVNPYTQKILPDIDLRRLHMHYLRSISSPSDLIFFSVAGNSYALTDDFDIVGLCESIRNEANSVREREQTLEFLTEEAERIHEEMEDIMSNAVSTSPESLADATLRVLGVHLPLLQESVVQISFICPETAADLTEFFIQSAQNVGRLSESHGCVANFLTDRLRRFSDTL